MADLPLPPPALGNISFAGKVRFNVKSDAYKAAVVERLDAFGARIMRRHHVPFAPEAVRPDEQHLVCLRSHGNPYILFMTRPSLGLHGHQGHQGQQDGPGTLMFVDRKIQPGYTVPRIVVCHGRFDDALFDGTVVDGEMVKTPEGWAFLANDLLALEGRVCGQPLAARLAALHDLFTGRHSVDATLDPCAYQVKRHEPMTSSGVAALRAFEAELSYPTRGMFIRPAAGRGRTLCLDYDPSLVRHRGALAPRETTDFRMPAPAPAPPPAPPQAPPTPNERRMLLRRLALPDMYDVMEVVGAKVLGWAHVPTARLSAELRQQFRGLTPGATLGRTCVFRPAFGKWEPLL